MQASTRHTATFLALALAGLVLSGCGTINEKLAAGAGDFIPQWAGGLPADAPPRRGTPQYDEYLKEQEEAAATGSERECRGAGAELAGTLNGSRPLGPTM